MDEGGRREGQKKRRVKSPINSKTDQIMKKATISFKEKLAIVEFLRNNTEVLNGMNYPEIGTKIFEATGSRITQGMIAGIIKDAEIKILIKHFSKSSPTRTGLISLTMQHNDLVERHESLAKAIDTLSAKSDALYDLNRELTMNNAVLHIVVRGIAEELGKDPDLLISEAKRNSD